MKTNHGGTLERQLHIQKLYASHDSHDNRIHSKSDNTHEIFIKHNVNVCLYPKLSYNEVNTT